MTHLELTLARLDDAINDARACVVDALEATGELPTTSIDGVPWAERRQRLESDLAEVDRILGEAKSHCSRVT